MLHPDHVVDFLRHGGHGVEEGRALAEKFLGLETDMETLKEEVKTESEDIKPWMPVEEKRPLWEKQAKKKRLRG